MAAPPARTFPGLPLVLTVWLAGAVLLWLHPPIELVERRLAGVTEPPRDGEAWFRAAPSDEVVGSRRAARTCSDH